MKTTGIATGQLLCVGIHGQTLSSGERRALRKLVPGAVILFKRNYESAAQVTELCAQIRHASEVPPLIAVDQEGGRVVRFGAPFMKLEAARTLARSRTPGQVHDLARAMARELRQAGVDIVFAPVLDVVTNRYNQAIGERAFGATAAPVIRYGVAFMRGLASGGIVPCPKHFPGHGNVREDSHLELPVSNATRQSLFGVHIKPFAAAIEAGASMIMMAHVMVPAIDAARPASMSARMIGGVLRERLGFKAVVATDDLQMQALKGLGDIDERAAIALEAGADMLLVCREIEAAENAFDVIRRMTDGPAMRPAVAASMRRIARLRRYARIIGARA